MKYNELSHFSHPHNLKFDKAEAPFNCDGCKEAGIGSRYKCAGACNFDLHAHCAIPSPSITHPFYTKCSFQFLGRPPGTAERYCNACEKDVAGFVYHCKLCGFDLHPCCAKLPMMIDGEIKLFLYKKVGAACDRCGRKGRSWSYRSSCEKYNLHVACVKEMLVDSWHDIHYGGSGYTRQVQGGVGRLRLRSTLQTQNHTKSICKTLDVAAVALQFVISAVLGDPTTIIGALISNLIFK